MKKDRNNGFFSNFAGGGVPQQGPQNMFMQNPNMMPQQFGPGYGPNMIPEQTQTYNEMYSENNYEARITRMERHIRKLEARVSKLESKSDFINDSEDFSSTNMYMI